MWITFGMADRHVETAAVHAGTFVLPENRATSPPLFQASSYEFADLDDVEAIYGGTRTGAIYGRYGGPNGLHFESAIAELEGAEAAAGAAAGMSAIDAALGPNLRPGDAILATREIYGGTFVLLERNYRERGYRVVFVDQNDLAAVAEAIERERPRIVYVEAITNPLVHVANLPELAARAHAAGALLVVDATFASPVLVRPLSMGADLVLHSVGKYIGGHGDVGAGVLAGREGLVRESRAYLIRSGATMAHFEAWLALRGLRTLAVRMERHVANARTVAAYLSTAPGVRAAFHPSLANHPQHELASRLYPHGTGGIVAFDLDGGSAAVRRFLDALRTIAIVHSLGEVATTISYPAAASHRPLPPAERRALGVGDGTLRISVGIEHADDIVADLARGVEGAGRAR
jgi:cystathionine beta-lyase/cystathionine gamma-synthase